MLTKRIIACLDVEGGRVVKGVQFENLRDAGDPAELAKRHSESGADEIVLLDISAAHEWRSCAQDTSRRPASGSAPLASGDPLVELHRVVELGDGRVPAHAVEVGVAHRHYPAGLGRPPHLPQRRDRVREVLEDLMGVDDVERFVREVEVVDVAGGKARHCPRRARRRGPRPGR